jgi:hypothetical protein
MRARQVSDGRNFVARVNCSELRRLRNADRARFMRMQLVLTRQQRFHLAGVNLVRHRTDSLRRAIGAPDQKQF